MIALAFCLSIVLGISVPSLLAWDAWKRYLVAIDRTAGLKALEATLAARLAKIEATQAAHQRAIGIRVLAQAKAQSDSAA